MSDAKLQAVLDEDLEGLLKSIGKFEDILNGGVTCHFCSELISLRNLQAILPLSRNEFQFICNNPSCVDALTLESR
jgi:hypothetical protein